MGFLPVIPEAQCETRISKSSLLDSLLRSGIMGNAIKGGTTMDKALYDRGMTMRRRVLGDEYVDRAVANTDDFNLLTTYWVRCGAMTRSSREIAAFSTLE
jgi:hypothetical protein